MMIMMMLEIGEGVLEERTGQASRFRPLQIPSSCLC